MLIDTKYNIGQEIYIVSGFYKVFEKSKTCPNCKGKYKKSLKGGEWRCLSCTQGKIKELEEYLSVQFNKEEQPYKVDGFHITVDEKGLIETESVHIIRHDEEEGTSYYRFILNVDDKKTDDWIYVDRDRGIKKGIKYKKVHLTKRTALNEYKRVKKILDARTL